jgi:hypothetical protein
MNGITPPDTDEENKIREIRQEKNQGSGRDPYGGHGRACAGIILILLTTNARGIANQRSYFHMIELQNWQYRVLTMDDIVKNPLIPFSFITIREAGKSRKK